MSILRSFRFGKQSFNDAILDPFVLFPFFFALSAADPFPFRCALPLEQGPPQKLSLSPLLFSFLYPLFEALFETQCSRLLEMAYDG